MKLNIKELTRNAWTIVNARPLTDEPPSINPQGAWVEAFARLIVERCATVCEEEAAGHRDGFGEHCAIMIRRNLLEDE